MGAFAASAAVQIIMRLQNQKIVFFTPGNLGPHHIARFIKLLEVYPNSLVVNVRWEDPRQWEVDSGCLQDRLAVIECALNGTGARQAKQAVLRFLDENKPDIVVLAGYNDATQLAAARWAKKNRVPRILQADSWHGDRPRYWFTELIKRHYFVQPHFDTAFVPGERGFRYMRSLGFPEKAIWRGSYVVDNDYFNRQAAIVREQPQSWRLKLGLPANYFLTVARLSSEKNLFLLLEAFRLYKECGGAWGLVIVGAGPQATQLQKYAVKSQIPDVQWAGWRPYEKLPAYYALSRCLVLPSVSEPWGLVVNEGLASGLPVLVSRKCGCLPELCQRGINGFDFDPFDAEGLVQLFQLIAGGSLDLQALGAASWRLIQSYSLETWVQSLQDCIEATSHRM